MNDEPINDEEPSEVEQKFRDLAEFFEDRALHHKRESRLWLVVLIVCLSMVLFALLAPTAWLSTVYDWIEQ